MTNRLKPDQLNAIHLLLDRVASRQRQDFGNIVSDVKPDGTLITACDRWSDAALVEGIAAIAPGMAAALLATVAGLGVAIPALFGYNYLSSRAKDIGADMHVFADELVAKINEQHGA